MPPLAAKLTEYAVPTTPLNGPAVVMDGIAGTVSVREADFDESPIEVAVTVIVCAELVAAGAVNIAVVVVVFDSVPPPVTVQVTPAALWSLVTVAVRLTGFVPSTVCVDAAIETPSIGDGAEVELPPHPAKAIMQKDDKTVHTNAHFLPNISHTSVGDLVDGQTYLGEYKPEGMYGP